MSCRCRRSGVSTVSSSLGCLATCRRCATRKSWAAPHRAKCGCLVTKSAAARAVLIRTSAPSACLRQNSWCAAASLRYSRNSNASCRRAASCAFCCFAVDAANGDRRHLGVDMGQLKGATVYSVDVSEAAVRPQQRIARDLFAEVVGGRPFVGVVMKQAVARARKGRSGGFHSAFLH